MKYPSHRHVIFTPPYRLLLNLRIEARHTSIWILRHQSVGGYHHKAGTQNKAPHLLGPTQRAFANLSDMNQSPRESIRDHIMQHCGVRSMIHWFCMSVIELGHFTWPLLEESLSEVILMLPLTAHWLYRLPHRLSLVPPAHCIKIFLRQIINSWRLEDRIQPKTSPFSTRDLIWANYKVVY